MHRHRYRSRIAAALSVLLLTACSGAHEGSIPSTSASEIKKPSKKIDLTSGESLTLTPNFKAGFGACEFSEGAQTCVPGPSASLDGGTVDFGNIQAGIDYVYQYALQVGVVVPSAGVLYAEATTAFSGPSTLPTSVLSWEPSTISTSGTDSNRAIDVGRPFATVSSPGTGQTTPIETLATGSKTFDYDYLLRIPAGTTVGSYEIGLQYTVVP